VEEVSAIVLYVGDGAQDLWYSNPGYYYGDPMSWMVGPYDTMAGAYHAFQDYALEILDDGQE
jgi:hypothetical protein